MRGEFVDSNIVIDSLSEAANIMRRKLGFDSRAIRAVEEATYTAWRKINSFGVYYAANTENLDQETPSTSLLILS